MFVLTQHSARVGSEVQTKLTLTTLNSETWICDHFELFLFLEIGKAK